MSALVLSLSVSCAAFQPLVRGQSAGDERELHDYENNLIHWNLLSTQHDALEPIPPVSRAHDGEIAENAAGLNRLFRIAFDFVGVESADRPVDTGLALPDLEEIRRQSDGRIVTVYIGQASAEEDTPYVRGVLLSEDGWVLTVRHPFENRVCSPDQAYLRIPGDEGAYPLVSCRSGSGTNVMMAKFDVDSETIAPVFPPLFSLPRHSEKGFLLLDSETGAIEIIEITDTGIPLQIGSDLVYEENFIADASESIYEAVSGTPVWNRFGEIIGLYYHRSADGSTVGFAELSDLPRQIGDTIRATHRKVTRERR